MLVVDDGLEYILGFIARKFNKQPRKKGVTVEKRLGDFSYKRQCAGDGYVEQLSSGGLTVPTNDKRVLLQELKNA
jgi:hypothetical protein